MFGRGGAGTDGGVCCPKAAKKNNSITAVSLHLFQTFAVGKFSVSQPTMTSVWGFEKPVGGRSDKNELIWRKVLFPAQCFHTTNILLLKQVEFEQNMFLNKYRF